ncbi:hypothetical protein [Chryseobacterium sp. G0201]|uniref:hypothetical protein n=1 Tax=Chryseobacterium sp. G0201 TaxID=2487065 RepID=UPI000F4F7F66|nr:hypothetical protein [Chryseobacterium sp. G0201]AZA54016.1 hypothetical protein EG348_13915 [Chryseobacterium sp. G0201]
MKKKVNIIYQLLVCTLIFSTGTIAAQTGVFTQNPSTPLHIDAADDNTATISATQSANDVVVTAAGNLGVGVLAPSTKVDLRSADQKGIIGVGTNTQTAITAGAGAIRYFVGDDPDTPAVEVGHLQYSDGEKWVALSTAPPTKALVNANKSTVLGTAIPSNSSTETYIDGWAEAIDADNNFVPGTGIFTAPRKGFYLVSFNITLASGTIANNSYIETIIESNQATNNIPVYRTYNSYPAFQAAPLISNFVSGNCNAIFQLEAGNTIRFKVRHTLGSARNIYTNAQFNNISISEL